jgi:hypothetical protein
MLLLPAPQLVLLLLLCRKLSIGSPYSGWSYMLQALTPHHNANTANSTRARGLIDPQYDQ